MLQNILVIFQVVPALGRCLLYPLRPVAYQGRPCCRCMLVAQLDTILLRRILSRWRVNHPKFALRPIHIVGQACLL
jgi:hypothetical protein